MGNDYFSRLMQEANHMSLRLQTAFDTFRDELRSAILKEELPMTFAPYEGTCDGYWAVVTVKVCNGFTICMVIDEDHVSYGRDTWLTGMFDGESFEALKHLVQEHVCKLTDADKTRIKELETEIDHIRRKTS